MQKCILFDRIASGDENAQSPGAHFNFLHIPLSTSNEVPSPRGNAGRGTGRGVRLVEPPLPSPLLHKCVEARE
jgi:hypothetical protein